MNIPIFSAARSRPGQPRKQVGGYLHSQAGHGVRDNNGIVTDGIGRAGKNRIGPDALRIQQVQENIAGAHLFQNFSTPFTEAGGVHLPLLVRQRRPAGLGLGVPDDQAPRADGQPGKARCLLPGHLAGHVVVVDPQLPHLAGGHVHKAGRVVDHPRPADGAGRRGRRKRSP